MAVDLTESIKGIKTKEELVMLVTELATVYPYLKNEQQLMMAELKEIREQAVIGRLESYIKNLSQTNERVISHNNTTAS